MDQNNDRSPAPAPASSGHKQNTVMAILAYILFFIPLLTGDAKKDEFVKFHTKQGFALFLVAVAVNVIGWIMPFYVWYQISWILSLGVLVLLIVGIVNVLNNKKEPLPVVGKLGDILKI